MSESDFVQNTRRKLPHMQLPDSVIFITWRLAFDLPKQKKENLSEEESYFAAFMQYDELLDKSNTDKINLAREPYMSPIKNALHYYEGKKYELLAYCIMPNHVHLIVKPALKNCNDYYSLKETTLALKSYTAHAINKLENTKGKVWQTESYDHVVRDEKELSKLLDYVINNPVKAGLTDNWDNWLGTYISKVYM